MNALAGRLPNTPAGATELDGLLSAISEAIEALVVWNITAFQSAVERQRAICDRLALQPEWRRLPGTAATARKIRDLNRVYDRLLRHSIHWTHTLQSIHQANGNSFPRRASVHFRA
jgi:hypothetical protein